MLRPAEPRDIPRMLEIYAPYVTDTAITLEYEPPTLSEFSARFDRIAQKYPWLVWEERGAVLGYAYADVALSRAAYQWDADMSIYVALDARGRGIGSALYDRLEALMARLGYHNLYALVTSSNVPSCRFHEARGYELQGTLRRSGFKFGVWHDVYWYALALKGDAAPHAAPTAFDPSMF